MNFELFLFFLVAFCVFFCELLLVWMCSLFSYHIVWTRTFMSVEWCYEQHVNKPSANLTSFDRIIAEFASLLSLWSPEVSETSAANWPESRNESDIKQIKNGFRVVTREEHKPLSCGKDHFHRGSSSWRICQFRWSRRSFGPIEINCLGGSLFNKTKYEFTYKRFFWIIE